MYKLFIAVARTAHFIGDMLTLWAHTMKPVPEPRFNNMAEALGFYDIYRESREMGATVKAATHAAEQWLIAHRRTPCLAQHSSLAS